MGKIIFGEVPVIREQAIQRAETFVKKHGSLLPAVKRILFEKTQKVPVTEADYQQTKEALRYIVERVLRLTPEQLDAAWDTKFLEDCHIDNIIRTMTECEAPSSIVKEALFYKKGIFFLMLYPSYWKKQHQSYTEKDIFDARGEIANALKRAGTIKDGRSPRGADVDEVVYKALKKLLPAMTESTQELFIALADPVVSKFNEIGAIRVIMEARKCYETPLDFYFLNSTKEYQEKYLYEYLVAQDIAGIPLNENVKIFLDWYAIDISMVHECANNYLEQLDKKKRELEQKEIEDTESYEEVLL